MTALALDTRARSRSWRVGLPLGVLLAFGLGFDGVGIWLGLSAGLAAVAVLLLARWLRRDRITQLA